MCSGRLAYFHELILHNILIGWCCAFTGESESIITEAGKQPVIEERT
jgi:hypothetical protein